MLHEGLLYCISFSFVFYLLSKKERSLHQIVPDYLQLVQHFPAFPTQLASKMTCFVFPSQEHIMDQDVDEKVKEMLRKEILSEFKGCSAASS